MNFISISLNIAASPKIIVGDKRNASVLFKINKTRFKTSMINLNRHEKKK